MRRRAVSLLLILIMLFSSAASPVFSDEINELLLTADGARTDSSTEGEAGGLVMTPYALTDEGELAKALATAAQTLESGTYNLTGSFTYGITIKADATVTLNLTDVTIATTSGAPIRVESGASLNLNISGTNTLTAPENCAGLAVVAKSATDFATLTISGDGSLTATGGRAGAGIGGNTYNATTDPGSGKIIINSGTVSATAGARAAGIGGGYSQSVCGEIIINGGRVTAAGDTSYSAGIGGAQSNPGGSITINGGYVKATGYVDIGPGKGCSTDKYVTAVVNGGSIDAAFTPTPKNSDGEELRQIVLTMPAEANAANQNVTTGGKTAGTDAEGKLYLYVPASTTSISVHYGDTVYYVSGITQDVTEYNLTAVTDSCSCVQAEAMLAFDMDSSVTVNMLAGEKSLKLSTAYTPSESCTYPAHDLQVTYSLEDAEGNAVADTIAKLEGEYLVAYYAGAGQTLTLKAEATMTPPGGETLSFSAETAIEIIGDSTARFDLSKGNIVVAKDASDSSQLSITSGSGTYKVAVSQPVYIYQSSETTKNTISVSGADAQLVIQGLDIQTIMDNPLTIGEGIEVTLELIGDNKFYASNTSTIAGILDTSELVIKGTGSLEATSGVGAGIGNVNKLTVESGTVIARGGNEGAGIGGGMDGRGRTVVINGGRVYAYGDGNAAGIGGGSSVDEGAGGDFTINGGFVYAASALNGSGIGPGGKTSTPGTVTVNGGSVKAGLGSRPVSTTTGQDQYLLTLGLEGIGSQVDVSYSIDEGEKISTSTDEEGKLYLYLNAGRRWIRVYYGDETYYRYMTIVANDSNAATAIKNAESKLTGFYITGQIGDTVYDEDNRTVTVKVPNNIILNHVVPIATYTDTTAYADDNDEVMDFSEDLEATYTLIGHDKVTKEYTIKLILAEEPGTPVDGCYDITYGDIVIMGDHVRYGGTRYSSNASGYTVKGQTTTYSLRMDSASEALPPVTLETLQINLSSNTVPVRIYTNASIIVSGTVTLKSTTRHALEVSNLNNLADGVALQVTGTSTTDDANTTDKIFIQGAGSAGAATISTGATMTVKKVISSITGDAAVNALSGSGSFITDSETYMRLTMTNTPTLQPTDSEGTPLYPFVGRIDAEDKSATTCTYNNKTYYVGEDATLCMMLPDGVYRVRVGYGDYEYERKATISGAGTDVLLQIIEVTGVSYPSDIVPYTGGDIAFTVSGTNVIENVLIRLKPDDTSLPILEAEVADVDGEAIAIVTLPQNNSHLKDINYTPYYVLKEVETELPDKIIQLKNTTVCYLEAFELPNQISSTITESETLGNIVTVMMPYDHEFTDYYTPSHVSYVGGKIAPGADSPTVFTAVTGTNYVRARYTVTARDNETEKAYEVRVYKETTPQITTLSFRNPTTSAGGTMTVTARGTALASIANAQQATNKEVYIYSEDGIDPVLAQPVIENGICTYVAEVEVPANQSDTSAATHQLKVRIGNTVQTLNDDARAIVTVPRRDRSLTGIQSFTVENQVGQEEITEGAVNITMPYDAPLTDIMPYVVLEDLYASYTPIGTQDFTNPVEYTVTAENKVDTAKYMVTLTRQAVPKATGLSFTDPAYSSAGRVTVTIQGTDLANAQHAVTVPGTIVLNTVLTSGESEGSVVSPATAVENEDGSFTATLVVPSNPSSTSPREYTLSVTIGGTEQTLEGDVTLTVPAREPDAKELTDIILAEGQSEITVEEGTGKVYLYVPYNTDLSSITPSVHHTGASYEPTDPQDFNSPVTYTITAEDGTEQTYTIIAQRRGGPSIGSLTASKPATFKDVTISMEITGDFVSGEPVNDVLKVWVLHPDGTTTTEAEAVSYEGFGGKATTTVTLPVNDADTEAVYVIKASINGLEQALGTQSIVLVPRRTSRRITGFMVNGQVGTTQITEDDTNGSSIRFVMPYATDLRALLPVVSIDGDSYTPTDAQNFESAVPYTVSAADDTDRSYTVTAERDGTPSITSVTITNKPETYIGSTIELDITGVFFHSLAVRAIPEAGGEPIPGNVIMNERHHATATILIPKNESFTDEVGYTLEFDLDDFTGIANPSENRIVVPRRKTRAVTNLLVNNQSGVATITDKDIYVKVVYNTDLAQLQPVLSIDGDSYAPDPDCYDAETGNVNFDNATKSVRYTISAADDEDRYYTVHVSRDGVPTIDNLSFISPKDFSAGNMALSFDGVFFESAEVSIVPVDGGDEIPGQITSFQDRRATAVINIPTNYDTTAAKVYRLKFIVDNVVTGFIGNTEIVVPRRTTREITDFTLPQVQEGDTRVEGTSIYVNVPYHLDITSVTPAFTYDADTITPAADAALDFSNPSRPVSYTLSSAGDEDVTYTVYVTRVGEDPYLVSLLVEGQSEDTSYGGEDGEDENAVHVLVNSSVDIAAVEPILQYVGTDYSPKGPQNFTNSVEEPLEYTIVNQYGISRTYYVTVEKDRIPGHTARVQVSFQTNGGSAMSSVQVMVTDRLQAPAPPVREGYSFGGWYSDAQLTVPFDFSSPLTTNVTLYAKWIENSDVSAGENQGAQGGTGSGNAGPAGTTLPVDTQPAASGIPFTDVAMSDWYYDAVRYVYENKLLNGIDSITFAPDMSITRAMVVTVLWRAEGEPAAGTASQFEDVVSGAYYEQAVVWAEGCGIVEGYSETMFGPEDYVLREQIAAIIHRYAAYKGLVADNDLTAGLEYADLAEISEYALESVRYCSEKEIMQGRDGNCFEPAGTATRAELAVIMQRVHKQF